MALIYAKAAVALDTSRQYEAAIPKCTRTAEVFLYFLQINKNPKMQQLRVMKIPEYVTRVKLLATGGKVGT